MAKPRGDCALRGRPVGACCQDTPCELNNVEGTRKRDPDKAITERAFRNLVPPVNSNTLVAAIGEAIKLSIANPENMEYSREKRI